MLENRSLDESDLDGGTFPNGFYPIPVNMPVEGWPVETGSLSNTDWQQDINNSGGDRHSIIIKPSSGSFWETCQAKRNGSSWQAANGAKWNLATNNLRPAGWTSADAGGLPMFPVLIRYDECQLGMVEHAPHLSGLASRFRSADQRPQRPCHGPAVPSQGELPYSRQLDDSGKGRPQGVEKV